jgi:hypothetical protein
MDDMILIALIGIGGTILGSMSTLFGTILKQYLEDRSKGRSDVPRKKLLKQMLNHPARTWRNLGTLIHVIGADEDTTKRLLLEVGARASEDGQSLWGLISRNPFADIP